MTVTKPEFPLHERNDNHDLPVALVGVKCPKSQLEQREARGSQIGPSLAHDEFVEYLSQEFNCGGEVVVGAVPRRMGQTVCS